ncbi:MAG: DUF1284 domain-containing protein [Chloroflexi bacterium]|nr:DUF1284 domain-containing protein [Chloroflexota bacterium]
MGSLAHPVRIRGHHLLCMLGFRGLGYSVDFAAAMDEVVKEFRANPALAVIVVTECDVICGSCPHNKGSRCLKKEDSYERVKSKDADVLDTLGFKPETQTTVGDAWKRVKERISVEDLKEMCRKCEWLGLGYCVDGLAKLKLD